MTILRAALILISLSFLTGCKSDETYTLYRSSMTKENMRVHVATFDATDGNDYNSENCEIAKTLFINQPGVKVKYWCEKGIYKP